MGVLVFLIQMASLMCRILRLGSLSTMFTPSQSMMWFSVVAWSVRADLLMVDIFFPAPCVFLFFRVVYILSVFLQSCFSSLPVSPMYSAPQFLHGIWYTSSPCSSSSTLSLGCTNKRLRVVWGRMVDNNYTIASEDNLMSSTGNLHH